MEMLAPMNARMDSDHTTSTRQTDPTLSRQFAIEAARSLSENRCEDVVVLEVRGLSQVTDFLVIGTGTSSRQMTAALRHVEDLGGARGFPLFRHSLDATSQWLLCDFVDVVVHVFEGAARAHYDLELLWGDAPRIPWRRSASPPTETSPEPPATK